MKNLQKTNSSHRLKFPEKNISIVTEYYRPLQTINKFKITKHQKIIISGDYYV